MEYRRENLLNAINETREEIAQFKENLLNVKNELPDLAEIKRQISKIDTVIRNLNKICDQEDDKLKLKFEDITFM